MTVLPVIERELRAEARHDFTYWLRLAGASALLVVFVLTLADQRLSAPQLGAILFGNLHTALVFAIWMLVPLLTADCISRERREGTLGLLFLTRLTPLGVLSGKLFIHGLRATTMFLATLPILALPFLLGGVNGRQVVTAVLYDASSVLLALTAGLVASCFSKVGMRALFAAELIAAVFFWQMAKAIPFAAGLAVGQTAYWNALGWSFSAYSRSAVYYSGLGFGGEILAALPSFIGGGSMAVSVMQGWIVVALEIFLGSLVLMLLLALVAAYRLGRIWRDDPPSARRLRVERMLFAPRFWKAMLRGRMSRTLERNPVGWLEQHSAGARVTKWAWCLFIITAESALLLSNNWHNLARVQYGLAALLAAGLAFSAAASFRRERENGVMELLLVAPLRVGQIIFGRVRGLWSQFLPATLALIGICVYLLVGRVREYLYGGWTSDQGRAALFVIPLASTFLTLPAIGLYFSLSRRRFLSAWALALVVGLLLPHLLAARMAPIVEVYLYSLTGIQLGQIFVPFGTAGTLFRSATQLFLAAVALFLLHRNLCFRRFIFVLP